MAKYGFDFYGVGFYGGPIFVEFDASPVEAQAIDYGRLLISWRSPSGSWDRLRLVRDSFGYPPTADSGKILVDTPASLPIVQYVDTDELLRPERFYYYSVFVRATADGLWRRSGDTTGLMPKDWQYGARLFELTPTVFRNKDAEQTPFQGSPQGVLERFLLLFGFALDELRTEYETLKHVNDPTQVAGGLLPVMAKQWGFGFEAELGMRLSRIQLRNAVHLYKLKGTRLGVEGAVSVLTGWAPTVGHGRNLMLDQNEASFEQGLGTWTPGAGAPTLSRRNVATAPAIAGPVPVPAGASLGDAGSGNWLLELVAGAAGGDQSIVQTTRDARYFTAPVIPGRQYVFSFYARPDTTARNVFMRIRFFDRTGAQLSFVDGTQATEVLNNWVRVSVTAVAPANAIGVYGEPVIVAAGANERHWIDAIQLEEAPTLNPYESARDVRITLLADRVNRVENPSFEVDAAGWETDNSTIARSTAFARVGAASLSITAAAAGNTGARTPRIPVTPGTGYTASGYLRPDTTARNVAVNINWYDAFGTFIRSTAGVAALQVAGAWTRVSVTGVAPANAVIVKVRFIVQAAALSEVHYLDTVLFERGYKVQDYFDGSTISNSGEYMWQGSAHVSPSHFYSRRLIKNFRLNQRLKDFLPAAATYTLLYARGVDYESTPAVVPGVRLWLKADALNLSDGARVATWVDSSGSGRNGTQGALDSQPIKHDNVLNGLPVVRFDGANDFFSFPDFLTGLAAGEVFIVLRSRLDPPTTGSSSGLWDMGSATDATHFPFTDGVIYDEFGTSARKTAGNPAPSLAYWHLYNVRAATNAWSSHLDGVQLFTTATNTVGWAASPRLGQSVGLATHFFDGDIAEVLIYDNILSSANRTKIVEYFERKYGLSVA